ncbi:hypothetical protein Hdeb2414_s0004g00143411 [Helianthus debilis subsp. tardiflorus]
MSGWVLVVIDPIFVGSGPKLYTHTRHTHKTHNSMYNYMNVKLQRLLYLRKEHGFIAPTRSNGINKKSRTCLKKMWYFPHDCLIGNESAQHNTVSEPPTTNGLARLED